MPEINTLVDDIYNVFDKQPTPEDCTSLGADIAGVIADQFKPRSNYLRLSNLGNSCTRELWYSLCCPELATPLPGSTRVKFLIGHITEAVVLWLARLSGHSVTDQQKEVSINGVKGHIDGLVDDHLVDVKSASPMSFAKFERGLTPDADAFGYISQLGGYGSALGKSDGSFLAVDKVSGRLHLDTHKLPEIDYAAKVDAVRAVLDKNEPPPRAFEDVKEGESGNRKLGTKCSYCAFSETCWPGVKKYRYAKGIVYLTKVVKEPKVDRA